MKRPTQAAPFDVASRMTRDKVSRDGVRGIPKRWALAVAGGSFAGTLGAFLDAGFARAAVDGAHGPGYFALARIDTGLVAPVALVLGALVGLGACLLEPDRARSPKELWQALDRSDAGQRARLACVLAAIPVGLALWATTVAHWAKSAMGTPASNLGSGLAIGTLALGLFAILVALALGAGELCAAIAARFAWSIRPGHALLCGVALALAIVGVGIALGTTSGEGSWLGIWGVLKRPELDLRAPSLVSLALLGAYFVPHLVHRTPLVALALGVAPLVFTLEAAVGLGDKPDIAAALEQGAPLGKTCLVSLRRATDRDHDGYSPWFGGGDCDDRDPRINPGADDVPGNGIDEDCSGGDAPPPAAPPAPALPAKTSDLLPKGFNMILITVDTLRADLGFAGYPKSVSPNLDALAARSVVFDRAYSLASYTGKSLGPLLIGKFPSETHRGWGHFNKFSTEDLFVSERLQKAGIHTISVQAHWYMSGVFGLARGYDVVDKSGQPPVGTDQDNDATVTGGKLTEAALRVFGDPENTSKRFFAWVHYLDPHSEYAKHPGAPDFGSGPRAAYDGEVWYTDQQIGKILELIAREPWGARTAIVVTSDHGEAFGEHHMIRHGVEVWEELVRVPLLVYVPGVAPRHVAPPRSAVDLAPTLLDFFEVSVPDDAGPFDFLSGESLAADIVSPPGYEPPERDVLVDMPAGPYNDERRALVRGGKKLYVAGSVRFTLFDLEKDPGEKSALDDKALVTEAKAAYQAYKSRLREVTVKPVPKEPTSL